MILNDIQNAYVGSAPVSAIYLGDTLIWPNIVSFELVDLNLPSGAKWMRCNLGAGDETQTGKYFQWGDIIGYKDASHSTWSTDPMNGGASTFDESYFELHKSDYLNNNVLKSSYDAAYQITEGNLRLPTIEDIDELIRYTTTQYITNFNNSGINGWKFTSTLDSTQYMFIPVCGYTQNGSVLQKNQRTILWENILDDNQHANSFRLSNAGITNAVSSLRFSGAIIRGMKSNPINYIDLNLPSGTLWADKNIGAKSEVDYGKYFQYGDTIGYYEGKGAEEHSYTETSPYDPSFIDENNNLLPEHDAVNIITRSTASMPTLENWQELFQHTTYNWVDNYNNTGISGYVFTASNSNSIFLPSCGEIMNGVVVLRGTSSGSTHWTKTYGEPIYPPFPEYSQSIYYAMPIRPVKPNTLMVDLNLPSGKKWSKYNIGAFSETEYGMYFQWGDTTGSLEPNESSTSQAYDWSTCPFNNFTPNEFDEEFFEKNKERFIYTDNTLRNERNAAVIKNGTIWTMPSKDDFTELFQHTDVTWETDFNGSGINGVKFSKIGDSNTYIFLPAGGEASNSSIFDRGIKAEYWTKELDDEDHSSAYRFSKAAGSETIQSDSRYVGFLIRAVTVESNI